MFFHGVQARIHSAWTLYQLQKSQNIETVGLLTTINSEFNRVAMHAVREELLDAQAEVAGLPLFKVPLPWPCSNQQYEFVFKTALEEIKVQHDVTHIAYGDLFLEDVKQYRIKLIHNTGLEPLFPIWKLPTEKLAHDMVSNGIGAYITCVDPKQLSERYSGNEFNQMFLDAINDDVDPCGENGEFHTFVYKGPMFKTEISIQTGETVNRDGFVFTDLTLKK